MNYPCKHIQKFFRILRTCIENGIHKNWLSDPLWLEPSSRGISSLEIGGALIIDNNR